MPNQELLSINQFKADALSISEIRYRRLFESAKEGILILDAVTGKILDVNPFLVELLGYSKEEFLERAIWEIGLLKDIVANKDKFAELQQKEYVRYENLPLETANGRKIKVEFISNLYLENDFRVIQCNIRDITARILIEEALHKLHWRLENIVQGSYIGTWEWNVQTGELAINEMWAQIIGYRPEELSPISIKTWYSIAHPDDLIDSTAVLQKHFSGELQHYECECRVKHKSGKWMWVHDRGCVMSFTNEGLPLMMFGTHTDITERKHAEEQLERYSEKLAKLNAEKDKFFSIIAHDLRSPFNVFLGYTRLMVEDLNTFSTSEILEISIRMQNSATNLFNLLENLLEWSRLQQGLIAINRTNIQLFEIVDSSLATILDLAKNKNIDIAVDIPDDIMIFADKNIIQTIIRNIVSNAVKFTPKGGKITISGRSMPNKSIKVTIVDTGIGMNAGLVKDLFRLDVQSNRKGTEGEPSTGLGLIICKDFIELHGGQLWVNSAVGKGSTFKFAFPPKINSDI